MTSSINENEIDELERCLEAALKSNGEHLMKIQKLEKEMADRYLQESLLKHAAEGLYRQAHKLSTYFRQQHPAMKTDDIAKIFSEKLMDFQIEYGHFCKGTVGSGEGGDMEKAEKIKSLEEEIFSLKSDFVQMTMQKNQQIKELMQLNEDLNQLNVDLKVEAQSMEPRMNILADKLKSSQADKKTSELESLTHQVNRLLEDIEWFKFSHENDSITIAELKEKLKEAEDHIVSKHDEIAILNLKIYKLQKGLLGKPANPFVQPRPLGEKLVPAQLVDNPSIPRISQQNAYITIAEIKEKLMEAKDHIVSKVDEGTILKLKNLQIFKLQKKLFGAFAPLVQAQLMDNPTPPPIPPRSSNPFQTNSSMH